MENRDAFVNFAKNQELLKSKRFNRFICFVSFGCVALSVVLYYLAGIEEALFVLYLPLEGIGNLLRWLSLSSRTGDILAWGLYMAFSLIPIFYLIWKNKWYKRNTAAEHTPIKGLDFLLILLSLYLLYLLYCFINPEIMASMINPQIGMDLVFLPALKCMLSIVMYSIGIGYIILSLAINFKSKDIWKRTEQILMICGVAYAAYICYFIPFHLFTQFDSVQADNFNRMIGIVNFLFELLPLALLIGIIESGIGLVQVLQENKYDNRPVEAASLLAERSRRTVIISVVCNILENIVQIIFSSQITNTNFLLNIPFLPLILAFSGLLIAEHLRESTLLYDDNQMII